MERTFDISYTIDRELSWLKFNKRVLEEGKDKGVPLLERLKFISIFSTNLDEFYMVRVGRLCDFLSINLTNIDNKSGLSSEERLEKILQRTKALLKKKDEVYLELMEELKAVGIEEVKLENLDKGERKEVESYFKTFVRPILSPMIINREHPFPHLASGQPYIMLRLKDKKDEANQISIIPIPNTLEKIYRFEDTEKIRYIRIEEIIKFFAQDIFVKNIVEKISIVTVTRSGDLTLLDSYDEDEDEDLRLYMKKLLKKRPRLSPVKIQVEGDLEEPEKSFILKKLKLKDNQMFFVKAPSDLSYSFILAELGEKLGRQTLLYEKFQPSYPKELEKNKSILEQVRVKDILLSYPYHQIEPFIQLLKEAAESSEVLSIQITLYRLAAQSKIAEVLCYAAEKGKEVTVLMELKARFDEINNIHWAERLEEAGCRVVYGFESFKVHSKICLITQKNKAEISYITQVGTGNYNEKTAVLYTDFSLITADSEIGRDAKMFFDNMMIGDLEYPYKSLLVAPSNLKSGLITLINQQIENVEKGLEGRIVFKINSLTDRELIDKLSEASKKGVKIDLIVRGICCLVPDISGKTENINVLSIVGRFLEHHRIYIFGPKENSQIYISSADLMTRSTTRRVEIGCPIKDKYIKDKIEYIVEIMLRDNYKARVMNKSGSYGKIKGLGGIVISSQDILIKEYSLSEVKNKEKTQEKFSLKRWITRAKNLFLS